MYGLTVNRIVRLSGHPSIILIRLAKTDRDGTCHFSHRTSASNYQFSFERLTNQKAGI